MSEANREQQMVGTDYRGCSSHLIKYTKGSEERGLLIVSNRHVVSDSHGMHRHM